MPNSGLDPKYITASDLQQYFVDKDTGLALAGGIITFYKDQDRLVKKDIFELTGTPGNYTYTPLPNPIILSSVGTVMDDDNNDVVVYYYPYDADGNIENYYVTVTNSLEVPQFTREAWPNIAEQGGTTAEDMINFIPNGQFIAHNNLPQTEILQAGEIREAITDIAQGGWTFERSEDSTATDFVLFNELDYLPSGIPSGNPKFEIEVKCTNPAVESKKDLCVKFPDVNKFESSTLTDDFYTYAFYGKSPQSIEVEFLLIKNYGTGGSTPDEIPIATFALGTTYQLKQSPFNFGDNDSKDITADSYVQLVLRFPTDAIFDSSFTSFILTINNVVVELFPAQTNAEMLAQGVSGFIESKDTTIEDEATDTPLTIPYPNPNGFDLGLPLILTKKGVQFDQSQVGKIVASYIDVVFPGELKCDGARYLTDGHTDEGIPYKRIQKYLWNPTIKMPITGTGGDFLYSYVTAGATNQIVIANNTFPDSTIATDHGTGFTFAKDYIGFDLDFTTYSDGANGVACISGIFPVSPRTFGPGDTGWSYGYIRNDTNYYFIPLFYIVGNASTLQSKYFQPVDGYYMWFKVDGVGTDPAIPGETGLLLNLKGTDTTADVANSIKAALQGGTINRVTTTSGATVPAGSYFDLNTPAQNYYVWYKVDGVGTDPTPVGRIGILVEILSADSAAQVADKTRLAINRKYFAAPNLNGVFLRDVSTPNAWEIYPQLRFGIPSSYGNLNIGTLEFSSGQYHTHDATSESTSEAKLPDMGAGDFSFIYGKKTGNINQTTSFADGYELFSNITPQPAPVITTETATTISGPVEEFEATDSKPINMGVYWRIKI